MNDNGNDEPKAREILLRATSRAGLKEDDPLYAVVMAQAELFQTFSPRLTTNTEDTEAARAEITQLAQIVRGVGESTAKLERRFTIVGDSLTKIEDRVKILDEAVDVFRSIERHRLWWYTGAVFSAGVLAIPLIDLLIGWIRGVFHL